MSNPDQSDSVDEHAAFACWANEHISGDEADWAHWATPAWNAARDPLLARIAELEAALVAPTEAAAMAATVPAAELDPAPANSLPDWGECQMRVANSDFIAQRVAEGGYGAEHDSLLATELHRFIYEYDDADAYKSEWFRHRLEKLLTETKAQAPVAGQPAEPSPADLHQAAYDAAVTVRRQLWDVVREVRPDLIENGHACTLDGLLRRALPSYVPAPIPEIDEFVELSEVEPITAPKGDSNG